MLCFCLNSISKRYLFEMVSSFSHGIYETKRFTSPWAWLLPVAVIRLHVGDLHTVGWGEGP